MPLCAHSRKRFLALSYLPVVRRNFPLTKGAEQQILFAKKEKFLNEEILLVYKLQKPPGGTVTAQKGDASTKRIPELPRRRPRTWTLKRSARSGEYLHKKPPRNSMRVAEETRGTGADYLKRLLARHRVEAGGGRRDLQFLKKRRLPRGEKKFQYECVRGKRHADSICKKRGLAN